MPTYEYACKKCGEHLEVVQSFKDDPLTECPNCGGELRKVFSPVGITFKGSGFYKTDSRPAAKSESSKSESSSSSSSSSGDSSSNSSSSSSSDTKSSTKSESKSEAKSA
jgi:putative FmdB family regulatory protein